jgi:hypothetical protein
MTHQEKLKWLQGLRIGDTVAVFEFHGRIFKFGRQVARKTPSGRIVLDCGSTFNKEGDIIGSYTGRSIGPFPDEETPDIGSAGDSAPLISSMDDPVKPASAFKDDGDMRLFSGSDDSVPTDPDGGMRLFGDD